MSVTVEIVPRYPVIMAKLFNPVNVEQDMRKIALTSEGPTKVYEIPTA